MNLSLSLLLVPVVPAAVQRRELWAHGLRNGLVRGPDDHGLVLLDRLGPVDGVVAEAADLLGLLVLLALNELKS